MASDQVSGSNVASGDQVPEMQEEKPSFLNKVRAKAKKLKSKIKQHQQQHGSTQEAPASGDPRGQAYAPGSTDMDMNESDASGSDDEGKNYDIPYTPLRNGAALPHPTRPAGAIVPESEGSPVGTSTSGQSGYGTNDKSFPEDSSVLKSEGPDGTEQAVPTNYSYFNSDPGEANRPSNYDASQRKEEVPSSLGGKPTGLTPPMENSSVGTEDSSSARDDSLSKFGSDRDSELPLPTAVGDDSQSRSGDRDAELPLSSVSSEDTEQKNDAGLVEPSEPSEESLLTQPIEQDQGLKSRDRDAELPLSSVSSEDPEQKNDAGLVEPSEPSEESLLTQPIEQDQGLKSRDRDAELPLSSVSSEDPEQKNDAGLVEPSEPSEESLLSQPTEQNQGLKSRDRDAELPLSSVSSEDTEQKNYAGLVEPCEPSEESLLTQPTEQDQGLKSRDRDAELPLNSLSSEDTEQKNGGGLVEPSEESLLSQPTEQDQGLKFREHSSREPPSHALTPQNSLQDESAFPGLASDEGFGFDGTSGRWNPDVDTKGGVNDGNASAEAGQEDHHEGVAGLVAAGVGAAGAGGIAAGAGHEFGSSKHEAPVKDEDDNSLKLGARDSVETGFQPADNLIDTGSETLPTSDSGIDGSNKDGSFRSSQGPDLGQNDAGVPAEEHQPKSLSSEDVDHLSSDGEQTPLADRAAESVSGSKNAVASKLGSGDQSMSDSTLLSQDSIDSASEGKEYAANTLSSADQAVSSDEKLVSEKASEAATEATNVAEQKPNPDHQDKTSAISGLPSLFASKLGIGGGSPTSSPTSTPKADSAVPSSTTPTSDTSLESSKRKDTPYPDHPSTAAAPGLFDRVSGIASSLFGGGTKQPTVEAETVEN